MEKEENYLKCSLLKPSQWKKVLLFFVLFNIIILWVFYYKSSDISSYYHQSKVTVEKPIPLPIYNVSLFHVPLLDTKDMTPFYTEVKKKIWCFHYGIDPVESRKRKKCVCLENWFGLDCGIPGAVWKSSFLQEGKNANVEIRRRERPRRIILSFAVAGYQDTLDINIHNSFSVVDLFLTVEGANQYPSMLNLFKSGYLAEWQSKIIPFQLKNNFTDRLDPAQTLMMLKELWDIAWKRLTDFRPDDIFVFTHASSIISKDVLLFLKLYDGFSEPFFFELRPLLFKFWRQVKSNDTSIQLVPFKPLGCTFQFFASMCNFELGRLITNNCYAMDVKSFTKNNWPVKEWLVGSENAPSGWQCNLCCKDKCIETYQTEFKKFDASSNNQTSTINRFLEKINAFNSKELTFHTISNSDIYFAPPVVLNSNKKYSYLTNSDDYF